MASGELLLAGIAVVDYDHESTFKTGCGAHLNLRPEGDFDSFVGLGMDRITVEKLEFLGRRGSPGFDEASVSRVDAERAVETDHLDRQCVEEFVGKHNKRNPRG